MKKRSIHDITIHESNKVAVPPRRVDTQNCLHPLPYNSNLTPYVVATQQQQQGLRYLIPSDNAVQQKRLQQQLLHDPIPYVVARLQQQQQLQDLLIPSDIVAQQQGQAQPMSDIDNDVQLSLVGKDLVGDIGSQNCHPHD
ncbi:hypothetical protein RIF29_25856 [Crotalaria pallida]|uniref:Uncharacterized protein n=1 Tax=Crotalaria pallida TaxID=3830 RepID=A0AAN9ES40_CROPI